MTLARAAHLSRAGTTRRIMVKGSSGCKPLSECGPERLEPPGSCCRRLRRILRSCRRTGGFGRRDEAKLCRRIDKRPLGQDGGPQSPRRRKTAASGCCAPPCCSPPERCGPSDDRPAGRADWRSKAPGRSGPMTDRPRSALWLVGLSVRQTRPRSSSRIGSPRPSASAAVEMMPISASSSRIRRSTDLLSTSLISSRTSGRNSRNAAMTFGSTVIVADGTAAIRTVPASEAALRRIASTLRPKASVARALSSRTI